jgi:hypothetical protein
MKGDFTRNTFDPFKHFTRVLMQQGRVQLDADWNEQNAILLRYLRALAADLIGQHGGPAADLGFGIPPAAVPNLVNDFIIGEGRYYVDGILCEANATYVPVIVPLPPQPALNDNQLALATLFADGRDFEKDQYIELSFVLKGVIKPQLVAKIQLADPVHRTLTLDQSMSKFQTSNTVVLVRRVITYMTQPDFPAAAGSPVSGLAYLDVWERHITYVEDDSIREVALEGPDTATRARLVWQVKVTEGAACNVDLAARFQPGNRGRLKVMAKPRVTPSDPCALPPDARYRGADNQLYRVEIHRGFSSSVPVLNPTFKWSRENGSVVFPIVSMATNAGSGSGTTDVVLETLGRDDRFGLTEGDWVEVQDDDYVLLNSAGPLLQVQAIDRTGLRVTLNGVAGSKAGKGKHPLLRRWDQKAGDPAEGGLQLDSDNAALIVEDSDGNWLSLENGIQIQFQPPDSAKPNQYRTGDYWLIPARSATGDVEWPVEMDTSNNPAQVPVAKPPEGITHRYAPLAVIAVDSSGAVTATGCRNSFALNVTQNL